MDLELSNPLFRGAGGQIQNAYYTATGATATGNHHFGTARVEKYDNIGLTWTDNTLTFPAGSMGSYEVSVIDIGDSKTIAIPDLAYTSGSAIGPLIYGGGISAASITPADVASIGATYCFTVQVTDNTVPGVVTVTGGTIPTTGVLDICVKQLSPDV
jgi:hypothetical protein